MVAERQEDWASASQLACIRDSIRGASKMSDNTVGYRKPSKSAQYKKGVSGNPRGRPKRKRTLATVLEHTLNETVVIVEDGEKRTVTKMEAAVRSLVNSATSGDMHAFRALSALTLSAEDSTTPESAADLEEADRKIR
jgi:hypothetical protein